MFAEYAFAYPHSVNVAWSKHVEPRTPSTPVIDTCKYQGEGEGPTGATRLSPLPGPASSLVFSHKKPEVNKSQGPFPCFS